jgi:hypothetical protein
MPCVCNAATRTLPAGETEITGAIVAAPSSEPTTAAYGSLIRVGGVAMLAGFAIHIAANFVIKEFPPTDPTLEELRTYLGAQAATWKIVHAMRYAAIACLAVFYAGLFARTRCGGASTGGWEFVGLIGGALHLSNLLITNGLETFAFLDFNLLSGRPELFWLVFHATRVLFDAEIVAWAIVILGFSVAGWRSRALPRLIAALGFIAAPLGMASAFLVGSDATTGDWVAMTSDAATLTSLAWFVGAGATMVIRGASRVGQ